MIERIGIISRKDNRLSRNNFIAIRNEFIKFCGMRFFVINSFDIDTVPDNPGLYSISMGLSEYKVNTEKVQKLHRKGVVTQGDIKRASKWTLEQTRLFMANGGINNVSNPYSGARTYYHLWTNANDGWLSNKTIYNFYRKIGWEASDYETFNKSREILISNSKSPMPDYLTYDPKSDVLSPAEVYRRTGKTIGQIHKEKDDVIKFEKKFLDSVNNVGDNPAEFFNTNLDLVSDIAATMHRDEIIQLIYDADDNKELQGFLEKSR